MLVNMGDTDLDLIRQFTREKSQPSFTELVRRHVDLVYSAALRQVRSPDLAREVSQSVFLDLAREADRLKPDSILTAWLYQVTRRRAIDVIRRESRRQARELLAAEMAAMNNTADAADWTQIEPLLDEAMDALDETDRAAILLRFFENKSLREVGAALGASDDAAQKRVSRAVERLREFFAKRGVKAAAGGLTAIITTNAVQAAPAALAASITTAATALTAATLATATTTTASGTITLLKMKIIATILVAAVAAGTATHFVRQHQTSLQTVQSQVLAAPALPSTARNAPVSESALPTNAPGNPIRVFTGGAPRITYDVDALQGTWTGPEIGSASQAKAVLTITGTNLDFRGADTNEWYQANFVLHENVNPKQLIAVVTACPAPPYVGKTANAIYQFNGSNIFLLVGNEPGDPTIPASFTNAPGARQFLFQRIKP